MAWQNVLGGLFGGLSGGMGQIQQQRVQNRQLQLQELQRRQAEKQMEFERLKTAYGSLSPDVDIDPEIAQQFVSSGFSVVKSPTGTMRRPISIDEQGDQARLANEQLDREIKNEQLNHTKESRAFREMLQTEGGLQSFMNRPRQQREAMWSSAGMSGQAPLNTQELTEEDLAKSAGEMKLAGIQGANQMAERRLANEGQLAVQEAQNRGWMNRPNAQNIVSPAVFETWKAKYFASNPQVHLKYIEASRDPLKAKEWEDALQQEFMNIRNLPQQ